MQGNCLFYQGEQLRKHRATPLLSLLYNGSVKLEFLGKTDDELKAIQGALAEAGHFVPAKVPREKAEEGN